MNKVLIDTNFLYALQDRNDKNNAKAHAFMRVDKSTRLVPQVVLTEITYLLRNFIGIHAEMIFLEAFAASTFELVSLTMPDIKRAKTIMQKYQNIRIDFTDCCLIAFAERLNITQICTFDRRDFSIVRPAHCDVLELLP